MRLEGNPTAADRKAKDFLGCEIKACVETTQPLCRFRETTIWPRNRPYVLNATFLSGPDPLSLLVPISTRFSPQEPVCFAFPMPLWLTPKVYIPLR